MKDNTQEAISMFRDFIKKENLRNTSERELIIREIFQTHEHFDVDGLYLRLRQKNHKISKASIYRTIPLLLDCGLIQQAFFQDGRILYEHIHGHGHHCHMRCTECGQVVEFFLEDLRHVETKLGERYGFDVAGHRLEVYGHCPKCRPNLEAD